MFRNNQWPFFHLLNKDLGAVQQSFESDKMRELLLRSANLNFIKDRVGALPSDETCVCGIVLLL